MPWTYILGCADGTTYVGSTWNLDRRLAEHQAGEGAAYTRLRRRRPLRLLWSCHFERIDEAFAFEKQVQGWGSKKRLALMEGRYDDLPDLASRPRRSG